MDTPLGRYVGACVCGFRESKLMNAYSSCGMAPSIVESPSALLALLDELLVPILKELLAPVKAAAFNPLVPAPHKTKKSRLPQTQRHNVLRTCKALQNIGVEVLYQIEELDLSHITSSRVVELWMLSIGSLNFSLIKSLRVPLHFHFNGKGEDRNIHQAPFESQHRMLSLLSRSAHNLRNLTLVISEQDQSNENSLIDQIVAYRLLGTIRNLSSITIISSSGVPAFPWELYMSVKLGIPIQFEESPFPISGLKGAILDMAVEIRESISIIQDLERDKTKKNIIDTGFLDRVDVVRERRVIVGSMGGHTSGIPTLKQHSMTTPKHFLMRKVRFLSSPCFGRSRRSFTLANSGRPSSFTRSC
jgi:hypothetical protein